jgi:hypothetical protein
MARITLLFSSICSLFVLSWFLSRWSSPANCINSTLVGKVVIDTSDYELKTCDPTSRLLSPQPESVLTEAQLIRRIEKIEELSPYLDFKDIAITISVITKKPQILSFNGSIIHISDDLLKIDGMLERALLFIKLNNSSSMAAAAIADFLWAEFIAKSDDVARQPWLSQLTTMHAYCMSDKVLLIHYDFCKAHNELSDSYISDSEAAPVPWSLASTYTQILRDLYRNSTLIEKTEMLEKILFLGELEDTFIEEHVQSSSAIALDNSFETMIKDWLMPLMLPKNNIDLVVGQFSLKQHSKVNYVVVGRSSRDIFPMDFAIAAKNKTIAGPFVLQFGAAQYFYPSDVALKSKQDDFLRKVKIDNLIYVSCDMPEVESLLAFESKTNRVLFVRQCDYDEIDWSEIASVGIVAYLKANTKTEFIEFNLSALRLAKRVRGPLDNIEDFGSWQKWLLWQSVTKDEGQDIHRPLSAIDGVRRYRMF